MPERPQLTEEQIGKATKAILHGFGLIYPDLSEPDKFWIAAYAPARDVVRRAIEDILKGGKQMSALNCPDCNLLASCPHCGGTGSYIQPATPAEGEHDEECWGCNGTGEQPRYTAQEVRELLLSDEAVDEMNAAFELGLAKLGLDAPGIPLSAGRRAIEAALDTAFKKEERP